MKQRPINTVLSVTHPQSDALEPHSYSSSQCICMGPVQICLLQRVKVTGTTCISHSLQWRPPQRTEHVDMGHSGSCHWRYMTGSSQHRGTAGKRYGVFLPRTLCLCELTELYTATVWESSLWLCMYVVCRTCKEHWAHPKRMVAASGTVNTWSMRECGSQTV